MHTSKRGKLNKKENSMKQYLMKKNSIDIIQRRKKLVRTNSRAKPQKENFKGKTHLEMETQQINILREFQCPTLKFALTIWKIS